MEIGQTRREHYRVNSEVTEYNDGSISTLELCEIRILWCLTKEIYVKALTPILNSWVSDSANVWDCILLSAYLPFTTDFGFFVIGCPRFKIFKRVCRRLGVRCTEASNRNFA